MIIGGGMTAHAAARGVREVDRAGTIALIGDEPHRPYARPPLSKGLWQGKPEESVWLGELPPGVTSKVARIRAIDRAAREVRDDQGERYRYRKLLLATGGSPRRMPARGGPGIPFRGPGGYRRLRLTVPG